MMPTFKGQLYDAFCGTDSEIDKDEDETVWRVAAGNFFEEVK
jgi:hypothetical protein